MTITFLLSVSFAIFYISIGIGTCLKFYGETTPSLAFRFILFLPLQTFILTVMVFVMVLPEVFSEVFDKGQASFGFLHRIFIRANIFLVSFLKCIMFMPIFAGKLAHMAITDRSHTKHIIKRTKNECYPLVTDDVLCYYA